MFNWGTDSLGRDLVTVIFQSLLNSFAIGMTVSVVVALFLILSLFTVTRKSTHSLYTLLMMSDHLVPKYLFLILLSTLFRNEHFLVFSIILAVFLGLGSVSQLFSFLNKSYTKELKMYHVSTGLNSQTIVFFELFPLAKSLLLLNIATVFIQSIILESVLTFLGVGLAFGTPSLGFLLSDGLNSINRNPVEISMAAILIVILSTLLSYFSLKEH